MSTDAVQYEDIEKNEDDNIDKNIYQKILRNQFNSKNFILKYYQVIPKYYLLNHVNSLIFHGSLGCGKSAAAIYASTYFLNIIKKNRFLNKPNDKRKILVIGAWTTHTAFKDDLLKPVFHLTTIKEMNDIETKLTSSFKEIVEEGEASKKQVQKRISDSFIFKNLQGVFNLAFPNLDQQKFIQNVKPLIDGWKSGELKINVEFLESLRNSFVVVDECQRLYSNQGMNTYGFVIGALIKKSKEYNIHFMFLTGTMINNNISELPVILSILNEDTFIDETEYFEQKILFDDISITTLKKSKYNEVINSFSDKFIYYNKKSTINGFKIEKYNHEFEELKDCKKLIIEPIDKSLPIENHIGNIQFDDMNILSLSVQGYQKKMYDNYLKGMNLNELTKNENIDDINDDNDTKNSIHDGIFDPKDTSIRYSNGIYTGDGLEYNNLKNYSAIGAFFIKLCIYNTLHNEKTVAYHDRVFGFGIKQYMEILNANGFVRYGLPPNNNCKCKICGITLEKHKETHTFIPMRYMALYGEVTEIERMRLKNIYNQPNNLYGDFASVMLISSVAYSGVSFMSTNHIIILNKISNLSRWKQIYGRIVRSHSHDLLPENKHYVNVYTTVIKSDEEKGDKCNEEIYYRIRSKLNEEIDNFTEKIYKNSITDKLFVTPEKLGPEFNTTSERNMFKNDLESEIDIIFNQMNLNPNLVWLKEDLIKRIKDKLKPVSFVDFNEIDDNYLFNLILQKQLIKLFRYQNVNDKLFCVPNNENTNKYSDFSYTTFKFSDLRMIHIESDIIINIMEKLIITVKNNDDVMTRNLLNKLVKSTNYNIDQFLDSDTFWDAIYLIGDEYYDDDEINFINNHSLKGRDKSKMTGCYMNNKVLKRNGDSFTLRRVTNKYFELKDIPFAFKILSYSTSENLTWFLRLIIIQHVDVDDARKKNKGLSCYSFDTSKLTKYFSEIENDENRRHFCNILLPILCTHVIETHQEKKIINPFTTSVEESDD